MKCKTRAIPEPFVDKTALNIPISRISITKIIIENFNFEAHKKLVPMQPGDVPVTYADTTPLEQDFGFKPSTSLRAGLRDFAEWYKQNLK